MLMEDANEPKGQEQTEINIGNDPVMLTAVDVVSKLMNQNNIILKARGNSIPNAVAVANIITEKMLKGVTKIEKINLDTLEKAGIGKMTSTVEIIINKKYIRITMQITSGEGYLQFYEKLIFISNK